MLDLAYCLEKINRKYGVSYLTQDFKVYQKIERKQMQVPESVANKQDKCPSSPERFRTTSLPTEPSCSPEEEDILNVSKLPVIKAELPPLTKEQETLFQPVLIDPSQFKNHENIPQVTAKTWAIYDVKRQLPLFSKNPETQCEIASLTKIMTAHLVCSVLKEWAIDPSKLFCRVSRRASTVGGTSACLREGQRLCVLDLLYGVMLPSGNDAAVVLAEHFGRYFALEKNKINFSSIRQYCEMDPYDSFDGKVFEKKFVKVMNLQAK